MPRKKKLPTGPDVKKPWLVKDFPRRLRIKFVAMCREEGTNVPARLAPLVEKALKEHEAQLPC